MNKDRQGNAVNEAIKAPKLGVKDDKTRIGRHYGKRLEDISHGKDSKEESGRGSDQGSPNEILRMIRGSRARRY
jgi:hypothetical protein